MKAQSKLSRTSVAIHLVITHLTSIHHTSNRPCSTSSSRRRQPHPLHNLRLRLHITNLPTTPTLPRLSVRLKLLHRLLNLRPQIGTMETLLMHLTPTTLTIPPQTIHTPLRPRLLNHNANRIRKPHRIVRHISWQQEQLSLIDVYVPKLVCGGLDGFQQHAAFVLVEEFRGRVDVVVCAGVGAAYDHDCEGVVVD